MVARLSLKSRPPVCEAVPGRWASGLRALWNVSLCHCAMLPYYLCCAARRAFKKGRPGCFPVWARRQTSRQSLRAGARHPTLLPHACRVGWGANHAPPCSHRWCQALCAVPAVAAVLSVSQPATSREPHPSLTLFVGSTLPCCDCHDEWRGSSPAVRNLHRRWRRHPFVAASHSLGLYML